MRQALALALALALTLVAVPALPARTLRVRSRRRCGRLRRSRVALRVAVGPEGGRYDVGRWRAVSTRVRPYRCG